MIEEVVSGQLSDLRPPTTDNSLLTSVSSVPSVVPIVPAVRGKTKSRKLKSRKVKKPAILPITSLSMVGGPLMGSVWTVDEATAER